MLDLELTDEQKLIRDTVVSFAAAEVRPIARECDERGHIPDDIARKGFDLGLIHSALPEEHGGFGETRSAVTGCIVAEELAWGDLSIAMHLLAPRLLAYPILDAGTNEQRARYLPRFAEQFHAATAAVVEPRFDFDTTRYATTARRADGGYLLNGEKCFVPLADRSDAILVFAQLEDPPRGGGTPAAFIVDRGTAGLTISEREANMGLKALATHELSLQDVRIPAAARLGGENALDLERIMNHSRVALAALATGVARAAFEYARDYAKERKAFGVAIAQKQAIAFMLANMAIEIDATRLLAWEAAWKLDRGEAATREAALARRYAANMVLKVTDDALQVLGGHGYVRDHPVELWLRNARGFASFEGMAIV
ncbi:MAG TPA: acyl-CoA dehydrogenase family protein [Candidatus Bathyarchaeia archaeon]|nr:acyl-CoA dehydrogenase family protein [Candidatus Bathyarchaeia archaeon]